MRQEGILKHFGAALLIAVVFYVVGFAWIQHQREGNGPWQITFRTDASGTPAITIAQPKLKIIESVSFPRGHAGPNISRTVEFGQDPPDLPFGEMIYHDPTFLPGTVTLRLFGHEVELIPRTLSIDHKEYPWNSKDLIVP
ncbi:MAG TPA: hypothetical protein VH619_10240 [Verrucomicrobiae bacterium]|jgi:hypothetical protein|nr:hypothetical protein [Verrucomicrobiae bacterium]